MASIRDKGTLFKFVDDFLRHRGLLLFLFKGVNTSFYVLLRGSDRGFNFHERSYVRLAEVGSERLFNFNHLTFSQADSCRVEFFGLPPIAGGNIGFRSLSWNLLNWLCFNRGLLILVNSFFILIEEVRSLSTFGL